MEYLSLPLALKNGYLKKADIRESISFSIGLILSTRLGSIPFDPDYGCDVWEKEFSDLYTVNKSDIRASIRNAINKYEKRLHHVSVTLESIGESSQHALGLAVKVTAMYNDQGEEKRFQETFALG
jgi:phage baseplate assembly protein W